MEQIQFAVGDTHGVHPDTNRREAGGLRTQESMPSKTIFSLRSYFLRSYAIQPSFCLFCLGMHGFLHFQ